jgi:Protein of unknown function (DUF2550)
VAGQLFTDAGLILLGLLAVAAALGIAIIARRRIISRRGGVVECALRHRVDGPWLQGLAEYRRGHLYWHRAASPRLRPHAAFDRSQLAVLASRAARPQEDVRLGSGLVIVRCRGMLRHRGRSPKLADVELALSAEALTGLLSWLEASPTYRIRRGG